MSKVCVPAFLFLLCISIYTGTPASLFPAQRKSCANFLSKHCCRGNGRNNVQMPVYVLQIEDGLQYCCWRRRPCSAARASGGWARARVRLEVEDAPDGRGPHGSGRGRETRGRRTGPGGGNWAGGIEERKKGRAEILGRKRNFSFFFQTRLNKFKSTSNSRNLNSN